MKIKRTGDQYTRVVEVTPPKKKPDLLYLGVFQPLDATPKKAGISEMARTCILSSYVAYVGGGESIPRKNVISSFVFTSLFLDPLMLH